MAAVLAAGAGAALASLTVAFLYQLMRHDSGEIHVIAPIPKITAGVPGSTPAATSTRGTSRVGTASLSETVTRTLVDLTDVMSDHELANVIHEAAYRRRFSLEGHARGDGARARPAAARARGGAATARVGEHRVRGAGSSAAFSSSCASRACRNRVKNTVLHGFEVDFRWDGVCVEIDGPAHERPRSRADDRIRDAALSAHGFALVRFHRGRRGPSPPPT